MLCKCIKTKPPFKKVKATNYSSLKLFEQCVQPPNHLATHLLKGGVYSTYLISMKSQLDACSN